MPSPYAAPTLIFAAGVVLGAWSLAWPGTALGGTITIAFFSLLTAGSLLLWKRDRRRGAQATFLAMAFGIVVALVLAYNVPVLWMPRPRTVATTPLLARELGPLAVFDLALFSPVVATTVVCICYAQHVRRIKPERPIPAVAYMLAVVVCGGTAAYLGFGLSVTPLCSSPASSNLCGLGAVLVGIVSGALAMVAVGVALVLLVRPAPRV